jgi:hypothetical protein
MKTMFSKYLKTHVSAIGTIASWQRMSCISGDVGGNF